MERIDLASTVWPRTGYDRRNSSKVPVAGPNTGRVRLRIPLPQTNYSVSEDQPRRPYPGSGIIVRSDSSLVVANDGILSCWTRGGGLLWSIELLEQGKPPVFHSAPMALADGSVLVTLKESYVIVDKAGHIKEQIPANNGMDDSGFSPNVTYSGSLISTSMFGDVSVRQSERWEEIGIFGYDILPPAVYDDDSLAISGYAWSGLCRVDLKGDIAWQREHYTDLLPSLNSHQVVAAGSLDDEKSIFVGPGGEKVGEYGAPAVFAEHSDNTWIALSKDRIARVASDGTVIWGRLLEESNGANWSRTTQPIVDIVGRIYAAIGNAIACYDAQGSAVFTLRESHGRPRAVSLVGEKELAYIVGYECVLVT